MENHVQYSFISNLLITIRAPSAHVSISLHRMLLLISLLHSAPPPYAAAQLPSEPTLAYPYGVQGSFNSSLTIILVVLFSCFFIFGLFSFYIRQCIEGTPDPSSDFWQSVHNRRRHHPRGLGGAIVDSFPVFPYSTAKHLKIGKAALECAVCISEFEEDETLRLLPECDHVFHQHCIDVWLASHTTCPVCRFDLTTKKSMSPVNMIQTHGSSESVHSTHELEPQDAEVPNLQITTSNVEDQPPRIGTKFSKSHTMGHLLIQPWENCERYTMRLPEDVKRRIVMFNRAKSTCGVVGKCGGEGSSRPDRRGFRMTPSFMRTISLGKGEGSTSSSTSSRAPV